MARHTNQIVYGFDSFGGLPEDWTYFQKKGRFSLGGTPPEIKLPNIKLIKGLFEDTLPNFFFIYLDPVSFVHIDSDLYSSAKFVLKNIASKSTKGTIVLFDDFLNYPGWKQGESKAFFEWTKEFQIEFEYIGFASQHHSIAVRIL
ncbi:MAG: hypothetical protein KDC71_17285 [Acidobacteria bacterium]|nr:hypothetical protein [Acidobacteriota bacterium]